MPKSKRLPTPCHRHGVVTLLLMPPLPPLPRCRSQHQVATAALLPSCRHKAAITTATAIALLQCCHPRHCHHCRATAAATKLPPPRRHQVADVAGTAVALLQCCHPRCCHCCCTATAATKLLPPSCHRQAATATAAKLPLGGALPPSCCRGHHRRHACRNKHYTYVGIHNEYTLASTVIGTNRYYITYSN
jgi:hypothetical protein